MRVILINPSINFSKFGRARILLEPMPCIGLAYIAAVLEKNDIEVEIIDDFVARYSLNKLIDIIKEKKPNIVGISCLTPSAPITQAIATRIKELNKNIFVVLGNVHATIFKDDLLNTYYIDAVCHYEGEYTFLELVKAIEAESCSPDVLTTIKGISFRDNGKIIDTPPRELIANLDELPYPAWHLFPYKKYGLLPFADIKKPLVSVLSSRGCPYRCTFCCLIYSGNKVRIRSPQKVVDEIEYLIDRYKIKQLGFVDPTFPATKKFGVDFCTEMINRGLNSKIVWLAEARVDSVNYELLRLMKAAGCRRVIYGIESGVQELLDNVKKEFTIEQVREAVSSAKRAKLEVIGLFMLGLPNEDKSKTLQTIKFAKELELDFAKFAITVPFPGSELYDNLRKKLNRVDFENFTTFNPNPNELVSVTDKLTNKELIKLQRYANFSFYLRPKMILKQLLKIRTVSLKNIIYGLYSFLFK